MPGRRKTDVQVAGMIRAFAGRADGGRPVRVLAVFDQLSGPAGLEGREAVVNLPLPVLADILGAIPASQVEDENDFAHLVQVIRLLHRNCAAESGTGSPDPR